MSDINVISEFLSLARGYVGSGYLQDTQTSSLPLAYTVEEADYVPVLILADNLNRGEEQLLDKMLASAGLYRDKNCMILEAPGDSGMAETIAPQEPAVILCLGKNNAGLIPAQAQDYIPVFTISSPRELLENESLKRGAFDTLKILMAALAAVDPDYAADAKDLLKKYSAADPEFAAKVREYI
ncbi:MAG: hypothetical protein FWD78_13990 [Treponema sp.]|nr:hypothetical protein [Treponema sp.]